MGKEKRALGRRAARLRLAGASLAAGSLVAPAARADAPPITDNDYAIEVFQGPVIAPVRVSGLAGAMTAAVEGVEGVYNNAAAPAVREPFSLRWFDYDVSAAISFPGAYRRTDFNNRGEKGDPRLIERTGDFRYYNLGAQLQFGQLGVTAMGDFIQYDVASPESSSSLALTLGRVHVDAGYGLLGNQLVVGGGLRIAYVNLDQAGGATISMAGAAPEAGVVVKPNDLPWRLGATARARVEASDLTILGTRRDPNTQVRSAGGFVVPDRIAQPWEVEVGAAYQLGPNPLNPPWLDPHEQEDEHEQAIMSAREARADARRAELASMPVTTDEDRRARAEVAERLAAEEKMKRAIEDAELKDASRRLYYERRARFVNWPRERILLLASLLMVGPSDQAVALEGFLDQRRELVGRRVSLAPRFAVESELVPNLLRLRAGVYVEPSRFADGASRQHFTFGGDVRIFAWDLFGLVPYTTLRVSGFLDLAPRYENFGFGIGIWH